MYGKFKNCNSVPDSNYTSVEDGAEKRSLQSSTSGENFLVMTSPIYSSRYLIVMPHNS